MLVSKLRGAGSDCLLAALAIQAFAADEPGCSNSVEPIEGADSAVLICGAVLTDAVGIEGLEAADIELRYRQQLRRCDSHTKHPGLYLVLRSSGAPTLADIALTDSAGDVICRTAFRLPASVPRARPDFLGAMTEEDAKYIDVNGIRTRYFDHGDGPVLLLVHGGQPSAADFNAWEWQQNFAGLADNFRVIALDRIGQGYTDNPPDLAAYENYYPLVVEHLVGFIEALELSRVHLVGHSQGGWPVTRTALDHPDKVASLTVVDSTMVAPASNAANAVRFYLWHQRDLHPAEGETAESIRRGMRSFSYTKNNITEQRVQRILDISRTDKYRAVSDWFNAHLMSPAHPSFRKLKARIWTELEAGALQVPVLIVWGREDPEGSFDAGVAFYETLRSAGAEVSFEVFEESGHVPYMEYPEKFNAVVTDFALAHP